MKKTLKFKIGDKIRRKENLRDFGGWPRWCDHYHRKPNDIFEVEGYDEYSFLCLKDMPGHWDDNNFELFEEAPAPKTKFKVGDKVRRKESLRDIGAWIESCNCCHRKLSDVFEVEGYDEYSFLCLKDMPGHWDDENFELVEEEPAQNPNADKEQIPFERLNFYKPFRMVADERCPKCKGKGFTKRYQLLEILGDLPKPCGCVKKIGRLQFKCKEYSGWFGYEYDFNESYNIERLDGWRITTLSMKAFQDWWKSLPEVEEK